MIIYYNKDVIIILINDQWGDILANKNSYLSRIVNSFSKKKELTQKEHRQAIMQARYDKSGKPLDEKYQYHKKKILDNRDSEFNYSRKKNSSFNDRPQPTFTKIPIQNKNKKSVTWIPKHNTIFDKINSEHNKEIIIKSSRLIVENILKATNSNLNKQELDNLSGFLSLVVSESISSIFNEEINLVDSIKAFLSVGKKVYRVLVYINEKNEVSFSDRFSLANNDDISDYNQFKIQHTTAIKKFYGGLETMGQISADNIYKSAPILDEFEQGKEIKINQLEALIGEKIRDQQIIIQALTCSGFAKEYNDVSKFKILDHDGLGTLGDALLKALISESLFRGDPSISRGSLTDDKRKLENNPQLQSFGITMKLESILFSRNTDLDGNKKLATAIEAIIGAIYLSNGIDDTKNFVNKYILKQG